MGHTSEPVVKTENGLDRNPIVLVKKFLSSFPSGHTYDICLLLFFFFHRSKQNYKFSSFKSSLELRSRIPLDQFRNFTWELSGLENEILRKDHNLIFN